MSTSSRPTEPSSISLASGSQCEGVYETRSSGNLNTPLKYEPFGQTTGTPPFTFPFAYTGRVRVNAELYYNRDRYYDSVSGQFLSEDPLGVGIGPNLYAYADLDPISLIDPSGDSFIGGGADALFGGFFGGATAATDCENGRADVIRAVALTAAAGIAAAILLSPVEAFGASFIAASAAVTGAGAASIDFFLQVMHGGPINTGEIIGAGLGGALAGATGGLLGEPFELAVGDFVGSKLSGQIGGSIFRNLFTAPFGLLERVS
jgi:RHS repeat-associated protein